MDIMDEPGEPGVRTMHPAPSLDEAPPMNFARSRLDCDLKALVSDKHSPLLGSSSTGLKNQVSEHISLHDSAAPGHLLPPPIAKPITSPRFTGSRLLSVGRISDPSTIETPRTTLESSPGYAVVDGSDQPDERNNPKGARRRTGPLNQQQRVKAAIIRKIGACPDCRRRRVSCDPAHHGETWDSAIAKYGFDIPGIELLHTFDPRESVCSSRSTVISRKRDSEASDLVSPPASAGLDHRSRGMDLKSPVNSTGSRSRRRSRDASLESSPTTPKSSDTQPLQKKRKPLPGSRRDRAPHVAAQAGFSEPAVDHKRYTSVRALYLQWENEWRQDVLQAGLDLATTLRDVYGFSYQVVLIPLGVSHKHLRDIIHQFIDNEDERNVLKIILYVGHSYLDTDRSMILANPRTSNRVSDIRWNRIQMALEEAISDVLLIMDCPYWTPIASKRHGILEILAGSTFEDTGDTVIPEGFFTKALNKKLVERAAQTWRGPPYVTDLHSHLAAVYRNDIPEMRRGEQRIKSFPAPFHMLIAGEHTIRSSIQLAPRSQTQPKPSSRPSGRRAEPEIIALQFYGVHEEDRESLNEWLRLRPENVHIRAEEPLGVQVMERAGSSSGLLQRSDRIQVKTEGQGSGHSIESPSRPR